MKNVSKNESKNRLKNDANYTGTAQAASISRQAAEEQSQGFSQSQVDQLLDENSVLLASAVSKNSNVFDELIAHLLIADNAEIKETLTAGEIEVKGNITATTGKVGEFKIQNGNLYTYNHDNIDSHSKGLFLSEDKEDFNEILKCVQNGVGSHKAKEHQKNMRNRDILIMLLFMQTGMRKTALSEINIDDIDLSKRELLVIDKGNKRHIYYLTDDVVKYLKLWLLQRDKILGDNYSDALFISENKTRLSNNAIYKLVEKYCEEALDERISPHKLRSGFCSILYNETKDAEFVRRAVGHSNISTTQRYIVTDNSEKERAANLINNLIKV